LASLTAEIEGIVPSRTDLRGLAEVVRCSSDVGKLAGRDSISVQGNDARCTNLEVVIKDVVGAVLERVQVPVDMLSEHDRGLWRREEEYNEGRTEVGTFSVAVA